MKNKKGFTLVEVIVSFALIMVVMIYLLRTIISVSNKNNELITMQEYVTYESTLLNSVYKDVDGIFKAEEYTGVDIDTANKVKLLDIDKIIEIDVANNAIIYNGTIYKLPNRVTLRKEIVNGKEEYYKVIEGSEGHDYCIIKIHTKVYDVDDDISIIYQNKNAHSITIYFHGNKGLPTLQEISRKHSQKIEALPEVSRTGYTFTRWTTNENNTGDVVTKASDIPNAASDLNYYAQWDPNKYTITFNVNSGNAWTASTCAESVGGTFNSSTKACTKQVIYDATYATIPSPTRTGYEFSGWNTKADGTGTDISSSSKVQITSNTTLYAKWEGFPYKIKFSSNGGSGTMSDLSMKYDVSKNLTANSFTRTGYAYVGWNTKADGSGTAYLDKASVKNLTSTENGEVTLYAIWNNNTYSMTYTLNSGTHGTSHPTSGTYDVAFTVNNPTRTGYTFKGWDITGMDSVTHTYGSSTTTNTSISETKATSFKNLRSTSGTVTFTAKWTANTYTISYDLGGGSYGTSHPTSGTYDTAFTVNNPTRTGYTFAGWNITGMDSVTHTYGSSTTTNTSISGTKATSFKNLRSTSGTVTFKATWTENTATLSYDANGHGAAPSSVTMKYTTATNAASALTATGYTFSKWCTNKDGSGTCYNAGAQVKAANVNPSAIKLYAIWTTNKYYVDVNGYLDGSNNGGTSSFGTFDVYKNGSLYKNDVNDFYEQLEYGTTYEIKDIKATTGHTYGGVKEGKLSGTVGTSAVGIRLTFTTNKVTVVFNYNKPDNKGTVSQTFTYGVANNKFGYKTDGSNQLQWGNSGQFGAWDYSGHTLLGWGTSSGATSATYSTYSGVDNSWINSNNGKTVTVYAVWRAWVKVRFYKNTPDDSGYVDQTFNKWVANKKFGYKTDGSNQLQWGNSGQFGAWNYSGYTLEGWGTSAGATSATYAPYNAVSDGWIEERAGQTVNLYGVWTTTGTHSVCGSYNNYAYAGVYIHDTSCPSSGTGAGTWGGYSWTYTGSTCSSCSPKYIADSNHNRLCEMYRKTGTSNYSCKHTAGSSYASAKCISSCH